MKERQILMNGPMVRATLANKKTQTRRIMSLQPEMVADHSIKPWDGDPAALMQLLKQAKRSCPYGEPGDRLYVRETWAEVGTMDPGLIVYRADYPACVPAHYENVPAADEIAWKPSIHMPRQASRILLEITEVRVERLQAITETDCIAEGATGGHVAIPGYYYKATPYEHFCHIWKSLYGAGNWDANPWVWVVDFRRTCQ